MNDLIRTIAEEIVYSRFSCKSDSKTFKKTSKYGIDMYTKGYQQALKDNNIKHEPEETTSTMS